MAVQLAHSINLRRDYRIAESYQPVQQSTPQRTGTNLRVLNRNSDIAKSISSNGAFQASMERMILQKKIWEDFLEKLKQGGGGGGGSMKRLDRIAVSFMLINYLSDKAIKAIMENLNMAFLKSQGMQNPEQAGNQNIVETLHATSLRNVVLTIVLVAIRNLGIQNIPKFISNIKSDVLGLLATFSFQLNKLKEILEEELRESIKKLDIKGKIKKIKDVINNVISVTLSYIKNLTIETFLHDIHLNY